MTPPRARRLQARVRGVDAGSVASGPRIFAGFVRSTLDTIDRVDADLGARVLARLRPETRRALELASAVSYVPVEIDVEVTERLFDEAGATRACEVLRENLSISLETPLLSALVSGALRLFGRVPARVLGWASKMWSQIYRDAGTMEWVAEAPETGRFELRDLPACVATSRPYLVGFAAAMSAGLEMIGVEGDVQIERVDVAARSVTLRVAWKG